MNNDLKSRIENLKRMATPLQYIKVDTELLIYKLQKIELPELDEEDLKLFKEKLGKRKFKEEKEIEQQFIQIQEAINIITSKIPLNTKIITINHFLFHLKEINYMIEREKLDGKKYYTLNIIKPLIRPEIIKFVAKYDDLIKINEEDTSYTPLNMNE